MTQYIDIRYRAKAESDVVNQRYLDITGPSIIRGFRVKRGSTKLSLNLIRDKFTSSAAVTPSGAKVTETEDLIDVLNITSNKNNPRERIDAVYLEYIFGETSNARYVIVTGTHVPPANPNPKTHLLLGHVKIRQRADYILEEDIKSTPYGFSKLNVAGHAQFNGTAEFNGPVVFNEMVSFQGGTLDGKLNIVGSDYDKDIGVYTNVGYTTPEEIVHMETRLLNPEYTTGGEKRYKYLEAKYFDPTGKRVKSTMQWELQYDDYGGVFAKKITNLDSGDDL
jgi:hypothetical protein